MGRKSEIRKLTKEQLQKIFDDSSTQVEVLQKCGLNPSSGTHRTLKIVSEEFCIDMTAFFANRKIFRQKLLSKNSYTADHFDQIFSSKSTVNRRSVKRMILKMKLKPYQCAKCGNSGNWQGADLVLQLEHINGDSGDNTLDNLCFLCPNCHSQTSTYAGRKNKTGAR